MGWGWGSSFQESRTDSGQAKRGELTSPGARNHTVSGSGATEEPAREWNFVKPSIDALARCVCVCVREREREGVGAEWDREGCGGVGWGVSADGGLILCGEDGRRKGRCVCACVCVCGGGGI